MIKFAAIVSLAAIMFAVAETAAVIYPSSNKAFNRKVGKFQGSGVRFPLMHIYSECSPFRPPNRTWESLISDSIKADASRLRFLKRASANSLKVDEEEEAANVPVQSDLKIGEYIIQVDIGTPKQSMYTFIDTGSDVAWIPCKQCQDCDTTAASPFDPAMSSSYKSLACDSEPCQQGMPTYTSCGMQSECGFDILYGSGSQTAGEVSGLLSSDTITLGSQNLPNFSFGCADAVRGDTMSVPGLMGLGGGALSLFNQPTTQLFGSTFSYCLPILESSASPGSLVLGKEAASSTTGLQFTTLVKDPSISTFYYVNLQGISVGDTVVSVPATSIANGGGTIVDSGTLITHLAASAYTALRDAFQGQLPNMQATSTNGFETCYDFSSSSVDVPAITLHLDSNVDLVLAKENILINQGSGLACLAFSSTDSDRSIIGNVQQQNWRIVFDVPNSKVGFAREQCAAAA